MSLMGLLMKFCRIELFKFVFFLFVTNSLQLSRPMSSSVLFDPIARVRILPIHLIFEAIPLVLFISYNTEFAVPCLHFATFLVMFLNLPVLVTVESKPIADLVCPLRIIGIHWEDLIVPLEFLNFDFALFPFQCIHLIFITAFFITTTIWLHLLENYIVFLVEHLVFFHHSIQGLNMFLFSNLLALDQWAALIQEWLHNGSSLLNVWFDTSQIYAILIESDINLGIFRYFWDFFWMLCENSKENVWSFC